MTEKSHAELKSYVRELQILNNKPILEDESSDLDYFGNLTVSLPKSTNMFIPSWVIMNFGTLILTMPVKKLIRACSMNWALFF